MSDKLTDKDLSEGGQRAGEMRSFMAVQKALDVHGTEPPVHLNDNAIEKAKRLIEARWSDTADNLVAAAVILEIRAINLRKRAENIRQNIPAVVDTISQGMNYEQESYELAQKVAGETFDGS